MKYFYCMLSNLVLILKRLFGCNVQYSYINLISPFATLRTHGDGSIVLGRKVYIRPYAEISVRNGAVAIGDNCFVNRNCMIVSHGKISMGRGTTIGPGVCLYDHNHGKNGDLYEVGEISIGNNVWIGANCVILKDVHIGNNVVIGAGSVVTHDIEDNTVFYQKREDVYINENENK